jgi:hypothetical protein
VTNPTRLNVSSGAPWEAVVDRRRTRRAVLRAPAQEGGPRPPRSSSWSATRRTTPSAGASSSPTRRSATSATADPESYRRSPTASRTGTTSTSTSAAHDHQRRPRLQRHRARRAAADPAGARRRARRRDALRHRRRRRRLRSRRSARRRRPGRRRGRHQQPHPRPVRRHFRPDLDVRHARLPGSAPRRLFDAFTFIFVENEHGVFQAHAYRFDAENSAFIVECDEASWRAAGFDRWARPRPPLRGDVRALAGRPPARQQRRRTCSRPGCASRA